MIEADDIEDENGDIDFDKWMALTDEQQEAIIDKEWHRLKRMLEKLTPAQLYARNRNRLLDLSRKNRRRLRDPNMQAFSFVWEESLQRIRTSMVKARAEYYGHGQVGTA